jgi:hypothetical protein
MLCPSGDKIMPVAALCQDFAGNLSMALYKLESITYKIFASKCFKNRGKKVALL